MLDTELVWNLQRANQIALSFANSLDLEEISRLGTDGLVKYFDCTFARIWLVEPDGKMLRLVASSGLYTRTDGSFSRIPMGAYKIGRIAQNRVSLLSNKLPEESWVRYPEWAIANKLKSFAGYPLANSDKVIGVLAAFSQNPMRQEFLEVLLNLCTSLTVALEIASLHQQEKQNLQAVKSTIILPELSLSDSLARILVRTKLTVLGTERSLDLSQTQVFLKVAEILKTLDCTYCRLTYEVDSVSLEAIADTSSIISQSPKEWEQVFFGNLMSIVSFCGGILEINTEASIQVIQVSLTFPSPVNAPDLPLCIQCRLPLLQTGFTQLAYLANLKISASGERHIPLLTDRPSLVSNSDRIIWVNQNNSTIVPSGIKAQINLSTTSSQLKEAVATIMNGGNWGLDNLTQEQQILSQREREVIALLAKGLRDRDIAEHLHISNSTVKFHVNNILVKLEAKTRLQALYKLMNTEGLEL
ncbi:conserved hypothetical protein [Hyella patelloides LEGE 07179]|uniref:HTH luxR-type domain-containing protein n=1 Tax=Hyella patelloides LEGE 07179 TaxID=945734 RepID=A0A563VPC5_9CYAN|nr:LuxR C-terminal-related transcriptional regulator [Hyella patelloides]VEP13195.1 conserved hypothetical protein [Hyella patelloides LEGE 07179]